MNHEILWQTESQSSINEQLQAVSTVYGKYVKISNRSVWRKSFLILGLVNIVGIVFFVQVWPALVWLKVIGLNVLFGFAWYQVMMWRNNRVKRKHWNNMEDDSLREKEVHQVYLKSDGFHCGEIFYTWADIQFYLLVEGWLFLRKRGETEQISATKMDHLTEEEVEELRTILDSHTTSADHLKHIHER